MTEIPSPQPGPRTEFVLSELRSALNAMLTFFGMDEDENSKEVFDKARQAYNYAEIVMRPLEPWERQSLEDFRACVHRWHEKACTKGYDGVEAMCDTAPAIQAPEGGPHKLCAGSAGCMRILEGCNGPDYCQLADEATPAPQATPAERLDRLLWEAIDYAASHPVEARDVDPRTWHHLLTYSTYTPSPAEGDADALAKALEAVCLSVSSLNSGPANAIKVGGEKVFWQREEWVRWILDEVLPDARKVLNAHTMQAATHPQPKGTDEPHGWVVWWPKPGGGHSPLYSHGPEKQSFGSELDALLKHYPVYEAPQAVQAPAPDADSDESRQAFSDAADADKNMTRWQVWRHAVTWAQKQAAPSPAVAPEPAWELPMPAVGDYVLATKWDDGDPGDNWALGFYTHSDTLNDNEQTRRYYVADSAGNNIRGNGFRKVHGPIRGDVGRWLLEVASKQLEASPPGTVNLWTMLTATAFDLERDRERAAIASRVPVQGSES